jgi:hypothetical protein
MAVARNIGDASQSIKAGKWERSRLVGCEAKGKTLAIVGLGKGMSMFVHIFVLIFTPQSVLPLLASPTV